VASAARLTLVLGLSSLWQAVSGYTDVFSHRFIFRNFDPPLNPAHISLYTASLTGLFSIYYLRRETGTSLPATGRAVNVALAGGVLEVSSGVANEFYHQAIEGFYPSAPLHFAIHASFVVSMLVVSLGCLLASVSVSASGLPAWKGFSFSFSSLWLLLIGSVSYLIALAPQSVSGPLYLSVCSFLVSLISAPVLSSAPRPGSVTLAAAVWLAVNGALILYFTGIRLFVPYPVLAAAAVEYSSLKLRKYVHVSSGAAIGVASFWLFYPYSFELLGGAAQTLILSAVLAALSGVLGSLAGVGAGRSVAGRIVPGVFSP
jgi:hypothetical protein